jgi:hypothetical protein
MNFELNFPELDQSSGLNLGSELNSGSTKHDGTWEVVDEITAIQFVVL